jgi:NTE family protein
MPPTKLLLPPTTPAFSVALSGGGMRATLSAVGVLRFLADAGLLGRVTVVSSVSGGSIASGLFARAYPELEEDGFSTESFVRSVQKVAVKSISRHSMTYALARNLWRILVGVKNTEILADVLDRWYFDRLELPALPERCRFIFNATNLTTGMRFGFERDSMGDFVIGHVPPGATRMALAIACSASVPGWYPAYQLTAPFPCGDGLPTALVDGGVYDNTGTSPPESIARSNPANYCIVALNAGGVFRVGGYGYIPILRDLLRSESVLYRESTTTRMKDLVGLYKQFEQSGKGFLGVQFALGTTFNEAGLTNTERDGLAEWRSDGRAEQDAKLSAHLATLPTSLSRFSADDCHQLIYRGWWLTGASLATYHRELLPTQLPRWVPRT